MTHPTPDIIENGNGTFGWECPCGSEADEYEDRDAAEVAADEHCRAADFGDQIADHRAGY